MDSYFERDGKLADGGGVAWKSCAQGDSHHPAQASTGVQWHGNFHWGNRRRSGDDSNPKRGVRLAAHKVCLF